MDSTVGFPFDLNVPVDSQPENLDLQSESWPLMPQDISSPTSYQTTPLSVHSPDELSPLNKSTSHCLPSTFNPPFISSQSVAFLPTVVSPAEDVPYTQIAEVDHQALPEVMSFPNAIPIDLPTPPLPDLGLQLRLSFNTLGIANPHPDDYLRTRIPIESVDLSNPPSMEDVVGPTPSALLPKESHCSRSTNTPLLEPSRARAKPAEMITPPDEQVDFDWHGPGVVDLATAEGRRLGVRFAPTGNSPDEQLSRSNSNTEERVSIAVNEPTWVDEAVEKILTSNPPTNEQAELKVLTHALPSPSIPGHAFPRVVELLKSRVPPHPVTWISLLHAVPGKFTLEDLPKSPPSTPGQPMGLGGGEDYFATKIFESAIPLVSYDEDIQVSLTQNNALSAPGSIHLAIVERYIPPPSASEFENIFNIQGRSLLVDRMIELKALKGSLIFVYPTRTGAQTFASDYLGPILDPILRRTMMLHNFSADLGHSIGHISAKDRLFDFDVMLSRMQQLCRDLSSDHERSVSRLHGQSGYFEVVYAKKEEITLERSVWSNWWIKQEKPRIRSEVSRYLHARPNEDITAQNLIHEILDGVARNPYPAGTQPSSKIEVGLFVIHRGRSNSQM